MIYGVGIDILKTNRVNLTLSEKILSKREKAIYEVLKKEERKREFLAGRFAAKEAFFKALKIGIGKIPFKDVQIIYNNDLGNPELFADGKAKELLGDLNISAVHTSITHEKDYVVAVVILEI